MRPNSTLTRPKRDDPAVIELLRAYPFTADLLDSSSPHGKRAFYLLSLKGMELFCRSPRATQQNLVNYSADPNSAYRGRLTA